METENASPINKLNDTNKSPDSPNESTVKFSCQNQNSYECSTITIAQESTKTIECDSVLINEMEYMSINEQSCKNLNNNNNNNNNNICNGLNGDGNDSGVETGASSLTGTVALQRALSNNSAGYASSSGDPPVASCNSSQFSVCSEQYDGKLSVNSFKHNNLNMDCTSEGGSESSSLSGTPVSNSKRLSGSKKRVGLTEPVKTKSSNKKENTVAKQRARAASANRAAVHAKNVNGAPNLVTTARARSREKRSESNGDTTKMIGRSASLRRPTKPDSLPNFKDYASPSLQRVASISRTPSTSRRTPSCTPTTEDGRWPFVKNGGDPSKRNGSNTPENLVIKTKVGPIVLDNKTTTDKYATMPRCRKEKSEEDLHQGRLSRRDSLNRDRMVSSAVVKRVSSKESTPVKSHPPPIHPPKARKSLSKTLIYHETSVQTALTSNDIDNAFAGNAKQIEVEAVAKSTKGSQVDIRDKEIERLEEKIRQMQSKNTNLQTNLNERSQTLQTVEQQLVRERDEKEAMKKELQSNTERVLSMLEMVHATPIPDGESNCDSLLMLESQIQLSEHALEAKQSEIDKLRTFCSELQTEMNRSMLVQRSLLEEKQNYEKETSELQDFLQDEKTAIFEALKDAEIEVEQYQGKLSQKEVEIERLRDECRHLVRIGEQRRQEYLGMQSKYTALESRSKEMIIQQNNTVSGATLALSDLGQRLSSLVEQLISSYSISEQDLEDAIYHNEAYTNSSEEPSPESEVARATHPLNNKTDGSLSPQRNQSFIAAIIGAIKHAASSARETVNKKATIEVNVLNDEDESDVTEMLDSETEPCLMMENVLEDVSMPDSHSHNMVSSTNSLLLSSQQLGSNVLATNIGPTDTVMNKDEQTLHNLCEAIANRQQIEQQTNLMLMPRNHSLSERSGSDEGASVHESTADIPSISDHLINQNLVDQVINVDNLVTKLLKILRIVQMDNDSCIQQLISEKHSLQLNKEEMLEKVRDREEINEKLKKEVGVAAEQLRKNCTELNNSKAELTRRRAEISKLNEDICNLSTLCSKGRARTISKDDILSALKTLQERKEGLDPELISYISAICQEVPVLHQKVFNRDRRHPTKAGLASNGQDVVCETKEQYDAINRAIETLNGIKSVVQQYPELANLQRDLEQSKLPKLTLPVLIANSISSNGSLTTDCNANGSLNENQSPDKKRNHSIDLSA